ncbi:flagellar hook-associated protein FlgL [Rhodoferax sp. 4810]|uniref:Flagellar hook-associated protein FlgL n=1 Tax=Thiospirillum jenense TaxID=1653858 RepID=A0A839HI85_9GAMM|nr:flagellar hook-associated protein FlgL [Thiospirillum jenense]MBB1073946.1 flagellar hook-associated protein FlgL [Rhodoferax jenense]MBB1125822.1 flagellar hook-associated protein FlgL [Thiospirillum jenense]
MRISSAHIYRSTLETMQTKQAQFDHTGLQLATGKRILTAADDPAGATQSAKLTTMIKTTEQHQRNNNIATPWLEQEEWAIGGTTDQLQRVRELVVQGNNDSQNEETRQYIANEIRGIRDALFDLANTKGPNGEYLFAGTRSNAAPFEINAAGEVSYIGATGDGAVRKLAIASTTTVAIGNSGDDVFMNILENDGRIGAALTRGTTDPLSDLAIELTDVSDLNEFLTGTNATDEFEIQFQQTGTDPLTNERIMQYRVMNTSQGGIETVGWTDYSSEATISFAGRRMILSGTPQTDDTVTSRPAQHVTIFQTLDNIATAFEAGASNDNQRSDLTTAANRSLDDLDATLAHLGMIRTTIGTRLQLLETQTSSNEERLLDLQSTRSDIQDLDYSEAISRFTLEQTALEAAQKSYVQVNKLSLFNFL